MHTKGGENFFGLGKKEMQEHELIMNLFPLQIHIALQLC